MMLNMTIVDDVLIMFDDVLMMFWRCFDVFGLVFDDVLILLDNLCWWLLVFHDSVCSALKIQAGNVLWSTAWINPS